MRLFDKLAYKYNGIKTENVRIVGWPCRKDQEKNGCKRKWLEERTELSFEGHKFFAPKDYEGFLLYLFGPDYMTPPPVEKQCPQMAFTYVEFEDGTYLGERK